MPTHTTPIPQISGRARALKPSATLAVASRARELRDQGHNVIAFATGEPDFDTPAVIKDAAKSALDQGKTKYMPTLGDPDARAAIAEKLKADNDLQGVKPEHIAITFGVKQSLYNVAQCLFDSGGDAEAILPVPAWVSYSPILGLAGARVVEVECRQDNAFKMTAGDLERAITPRSRALFMNTPCNPTGAVYTEKELREIADVVAGAASRAPNLVIITDEIYEKLVYGDAKHVSIGSFNNVADRTITINGLSKAYAMTGWRVGYTACPGEFGRELISAMGRLQDQTTSNITAFVYPAIRVALEKCAGEIQKMREQFQRRADLIARLLGEIPGVHHVPARGAFYAFPDVSSFFGRTGPSGKVIQSGGDFARELIDAQRVAVVPGDEFGGLGRNHIRISFACSEENIRHGLGRIAEFVRQIK